MIKYYFDFYYNGRKIKRCICERTAAEFLKKIKRKQEADFRQKRLARLTVVRIKKRILYTEKKCNEINNLNKSQDGKLKSYQQECKKTSISGAKSCTPIIKRKNIKKEKEKEKEIKEFPALKAGNGSTPETTQNPPTFFLGVAKEDKSKNAGVGLDICVNC